MKVTSRMLWSTYLHPESPIFKSQSPFLVSETERWYWSGDLLPNWSCRKTSNNVSNKLVSILQEQYFHMKCSYSPQRIKTSKKACFIENYKLVKWYRFNRMLKKALRILVNYHPTISRRWKAATNPWFSLQAIDIAREMGVTPGLLCQTRHLGHSHQLHWSDVSKLELWYCLPSNWKLFAYTTIVLYESEEYIEICRCSFFWPGQAVGDVIAVHSRRGQRAAAKSCWCFGSSRRCLHLGRGVASSGVWSCADFLGPSDGTSDTKVEAVWSFGILKKSAALQFSYLWLVKKLSFCQWQGVAGQERGGWCWVWMLKMTLLLWFYQKCVWIFVCLSLVGNFYRKIPSGLNFVFLPVRCLMFSLLARGTLDRASLLKAWHWQVGSL